ncbi:hypothetical protein RFI_32131, partial [Reticulomyxa filosa]
CKYCGLANHEAAKCRNKNNPSKHKCVLCSGQHPSNSVQCPQKTKERTNRKKNKKSDADEILSLRRELAEMKSASQQLQSFLQSINPELIQMGIGNRSIHCHLIATSCLKRKIDNWIQSISTETLDKAVESWTKCAINLGDYERDKEFNAIFETHFQEEKCVNGKELVADINSEIHWKKRRHLCFRNHGKRCVCIFKVRIAINCNSREKQEETKYHFLFDIQKRLRFQLEKRKEEISNPETMCFVKLTKGKIL